MSQGAALILGLVVVLVVLVVGAWVWYYATGWKSFEYKAGDTVSFLPAKGGTVAGLRFRQTVFTIVDRTGAPVRAEDVSQVLTGMAVAYDGARRAPSTLTLARPLNPFSFTVRGVNDPSAGQARLDALAAAAKAGTAGATLRGEYRTV